MTPLDQIHAQLASLRGGLKRWLLGTGLLGLAAAALWITGLFVLTDVLFHLSPGGRWLAFVLLVAATAAPVVLTVLRLRRRLSPENLAIRVEQVRPDFRNRLINTLQLSASEHPRDREVAGHLLQESPLPVGQVRARELFPMELVKYTALLAVLGLLLSAGLAAVWPDGYVTSLQRLVMPNADIRPFSLTKIVSLEPGETSIPRGDVLPVRVQFAGEVPGSARLELAVNRQAPVTLAMIRDPEDPTVFTVETAALYQAARYRVLGGDTRSDWLDVGVDSPPALSAWTLDVQPPAYTGLAAASYDQDAEDAQVPVGSQVTVSLTANAALSHAALQQAEQDLAATDPSGDDTVTLSAEVPGAGGLVAHLVGETGLASHVSLPVAMLPDQAPRLDFIDAEARILSTVDGTVPLTFRATDDYGLAEVRLERLDGDGPPVIVATAPVDGEGQMQFQGRFLLELRSFRLKAPASVRLRLSAVDHGPTPETRQGRSRIIEIVVPLNDAREEARKQQDEAARGTLSRLIKLQQENLEFSHQVERRDDRDMPISDDAAAQLRTKQAAVRDLAADLLRLGEALGDLQATLSALHDGQMTQAVATFAELGRAGTAERPALLTRGIDLEVEIISVLLGMPPQLDFERQYQAKSDVLAMLQKLAKAQRDNLRTSRAAQAAGLTGDPVADIVIAQEDIGDDTSRFLEVTAPMLSELEQDDFTQALAAARTVIEEGRAYEKALIAADTLQQLDWPAGIQGEQECLALYMKALAVMNTWRVDNAKKRVADLAATFKEVKETLAEMEAKQAKITEKTKDLTKRGVMDEDALAEIKAMDEDQKEFLDLLEKMAQDLYQFPDLPVANELNSKMREVYEDVEQATDSENMKATTIAVQKEDALLDAIAKTKERVEDVEMWLMDIPDVVKWDMETFDAQEFPDMPLVPLPDELEDLVGDLLDQAEQNNMDAQDSTGNNMMADATMGWGVADGPMPNFSAKGKSGNTKPNDNEMTGRSGAGREGQSVGELAEAKVKGLEGRKTHARKTNDSFQSGQVEEEEGSTLDARATGGGKLGGEAEAEGQFGDAPRRDQQMDGRRTDTATALRQDSEALYTTARLLYLGNTKALADATNTMRLVERSDTEARDFDALQNRVVRRLQDSQTEISTGATLNMPVNTRTNTGGTAAREAVDLDALSDDYRDLVSDYYKSLNDE